MIYRKDGVENCIGILGTIKKTPSYIKMYRFLKKEKYDWVYNRYGMMDTFYYRVLKKLHDNGALVLIEIPTYPYEGERRKGFLYWSMFKWDKVYQKKLKTIIFKIVTYSQDKELLEFPQFCPQN